MKRLLSITLTLAITLAGGLISLHPVDASAATPVQWPASQVERERRAERVKRFLQRTIDDLNLYRKVTEEDVSELEKQYDSIPPLESAQREADLLSLLDTQYSYIDWLKDRIEELELDLADVSPENLPGSEFLENNFLDMASMLKDQQKVIEEKIDRFGAEEKRLADILERRQLLRSRIGDLEAHLERIEKKLDDGSRDPSERENRAKAIRVDLDVVQRELLSLPQVDDDILLHYRLMVEQGRGESEWLSLQIDEYGILAEVVALIPRDTIRYGAELKEAIRRTVRAYENEIKHLDRKIDGLELFRSRIVPAGTLRETDYSRELADLYERMQIRYNDLIYRIRVRIGAWQAEESGIMSAGE